MAQYYPITIEGSTVFGQRRSIAMSGMVNAPIGELGLFWFMFQGAPAVIALY